MVATGSRQGRGSGAGGDRRAALRLVRRGPSEHDRLFPRRASPPAHPYGRAHPGGRGVPGARLAAPVAGRGARRLGGRRDDLHPARLRERRGAGGPDGRPVYGGRQTNVRQAVGYGLGTLVVLGLGQHRGQPARAVRRRRGHPPLHGRRGGGRRNRGGQPACLRGLHPRPGRTGRPPPHRRGTAAHRPRTARRRRPHHGHHQRAGRGGRPRPAHPPGGGRRILASDQDREQGGAERAARHPERAASGRRRRPDPARAGHRSARGSHRRSPAVRPGDDVHRDRAAGAAAGRGGPGRLPDHPGIADQHHPARGPGHRRGIPRLPPRRAADRRDRHRPRPARHRGQRRRPRARRDAGARRGRRRHRRGRPRPGRRLPGRRPAAPRRPPRRARQTEPDRGSGTEAPATEAPAPRLRYRGSG